MVFMTYLLLIGLVLGLAAVASNPSPYFAALGLVTVAGMSCGILVGYGGSFLSLILFLIYLGGILVVFAYSAALASEPYPEGWGSWPVSTLILVYVLLVVVLHLKKKCKEKQRSKWGGGGGVKPHLRRSTPPSSL
uniref:NADH-ubiquinone oxidoreductase chain 6 n=1 Tax=Oryzias sinensis TaxID=183150 RepID=A0A8C7WWH8_9TELE